jgi:ribonuclease BN (tRNA processing enzyme)
MQLVVLGSGTSVFHPRRAAAGFWLQTKAASILLDCSADAPHRMAEENLDWINLDAIWISHLHLDHCAGVAPFLGGIKWAKGIENRRKPLKIVGCEGVERLLRAINEAHGYKLFEQPFSVEIHEIPACNAAEPIDLLPGLSTQAISTPHRAESLAVRIADSEAAVVYTADTGYSETVAQFAQSADLLILECSFYRDKPTPKHLELADAMRIAQIAEPRELLLTHLYPEWDSINLEHEAASRWSGKTIAAYDGLRLTIEGAQTNEAPKKNQSAPR